MIKNNFWPGPFDRILPSGGDVVEVTLYRDPQNNDLQLVVDNERLRTAENWKEVLSPDDQQFISCLTHEASLYYAGKDIGFSFNPESGYVPVEEKPADIDSLTVAELAQRATDPPVYLDEVVQAVYTHLTGMAIGPAVTEDESHGGFLIDQRAIIMERMVLDFVKDSSKWEIASSTRNPLRTEIRVKPEPPLQQGDVTPMTKVK